MDGDTVEMVNMSGQLYSTNDIGKLKVDAIADTCIGYSNYYSIMSMGTNFTEESEAYDRLDGDVYSLKESDNHEQLQQDVQDSIEEDNIQQDIQDIKQSQTNRCPHNRYYPSAWYIKIAPKYKMLMDYFGCSRNELYSSIYKELEDTYDVDINQIYESAKWLTIYYSNKEDYENALINKNEKVKVLDPLGEYVGQAKGITNTGELIVDTEEELRYVSGGEVSVRGIYGYV